MSEIAREEGRQAFGQDPEGYEHNRPGYPERVFELLRERCGLWPGTRTFEIGPGTGQATRRLLEMGANPLVLIEPDRRLADFLRCKIAPASTGQSLEIKNAAFEDVELPAASFDLGVAATSFHWLDWASSARKVARLLRPGGWWAMWWNVFGDPDRLDAFHDATQSILAPLGRSPSAGNDNKPPFALDVDARYAQLSETGEFSEIAHEMIRWTLTLDTAGVKGLFATFSEIARLPFETRREVLEGLARIASESFGGRVEKAMITSIYTARRS
jgi:SAM-dependent methyltransferase